MTVYYKSAGVWRKAQAIYYKESGVQRAVRRIYRKHQGVWRQVFGSTGTTRWATPGSFSFTVPEGVYSLTVQYPTMTQLVTTTLAVTPGQVVPVTIGNYGAESVIGSIHTGVFQRNVISWSGNVDHRVRIYFRSYTTNGTTATYTGKRPALNTSFASVGIYYDEGNEIFHGDLISSVTITTFPAAVMSNSSQILFSATTGRGTKEIYQHPSAANDWVGVFGFADGSSNEGYYTASVAFSQIVPIAIWW